MRDAASERAIGAVLLRDVAEDDLSVFFENQLDPVANHMAAFTSVDPSDRAAFDALWEKILASDAIPVKTILYEGRVVGSVLSFEQFGEREVSYWIGREYWGRGIATRALAEFLDVVTERPLFARAAKDNVASLRVLEKCGFAIAGEDKGYANARGEEVEEFVLRLDADA
jgi:RimJ/RimL family protein N-acetyltransferase